MTKVDEAVVALASVTGWQPSEILAMTATDFLGYLSASARLRKRNEG